MSARNIVGGLAGAAVSAAKLPLVTTAHAVGLAKGAVSTGAAAAEGLAQHAADRMRRNQVAPVKQSQPADASDTTSPSEATVDPGKPEPADTSGQPVARTAATKAAKKTTTKKTAPAEQPAPLDKPADDGPQVVLREPAPPLEPPIDIVGQVLAAEAEEEPHAGRAGEPRGASREEEHGEVSLPRVEVDEIAEETAEALPGGNEADPQPPTPLLLDPALTKQVKAAQRTGKKVSSKPKQ